MQFQVSAPIQAEIVSTAAAEPQQFEALALPHLNDLYRTARRVISNATEAEDIVQETYLQAWRSFHRFQPGTNSRGRQSLRATLRPHQSAVGLLAAHRAALTN